MSGSLRWQTLTTREMQLRDDIAKGVLEAMVQGLLTSNTKILADADTDQLARASYKMADSMMKVRTE